MCITRGFIERKNKMITKLDENTIKIFGRIDSNNAKQFEDELNRLAPAS